MKATATTLRQKGLALPTAMLLLLVITASTALLTNTAIRNFRILKTEQATTDSFQESEGAVHQVIGDMASHSHLWRGRDPLNTVPLNYTEYSQLTYGASNGIPTCTGQNCIRSLYPVGGGLEKNFGPITSSGVNVDSTKEIYNQLNSASLPAADVTLNGQSGYSQVEKLDESIPVGSNFGTDMSNNPSGGTGSKNIRFRITGKTLRPYGTRTGVSTVVVVVELPTT